MLFRQMPWRGILRKYYKIWQTSLKIRIYPLGLLMELIQLDLKHLSGHYFKCDLENNYSELSNWGTIYFTWNHTCRNYAFVLTVFLIIPFVSGPYIIVRYRAFSDKWSNGQSHYGKKYQNIFTIWSFSFFKCSTNTIDGMLNTEGTSVSLWK